MLLECWRTIIWLSDRRYLPVYLKTWQQLSILQWSFWPVVSKSCPKQSRDPEECSYSFSIHTFLEISNKHWLLWFRCIIGTKLQDRGPPGARFENSALGQGTLQRKFPKPILLLVWFCLRGQEWQENTVFLYCNTSLTLNLITFKLYFVPESGVLLVLSTHRHLLGYVGHGHWEHLDKVDGHVVVPKNCLCLKPELQDHNFMVLALSQTREHLDSALTHLTIFRSLSYLWHNF